ncbi:MAG: site-specific DNA-methyltransferase [Anaerolineales bacterium]|nr:site-specific DNA-methyltransferase [Anaerolineales bacterium]MCB8954175.1 site-specific DNA-methyltransferase [Ardenticatenales bacterium]
MATGVSRSKWNKSDLTRQDVSDSPIQLDYAGKTPAETILGTPPGQYISLLKGNDHINRLYYGDNLYVLPALAEDTVIAGNVELIYIDPPFATGGVFQSRRQDDAYTDLLQGAEYIEFMRQRLILLRKLLSETGSIYVHLDANMLFPMKLIMDEIFSERNFRNCITRKKCNPKNYTRKTYGNVSDHILFYTKSANYTWNRSYKAWSRQDSEQEYPYVEETTGRRYKKVPIHAPGTRNGETGKPWRGMLPPPGKHWQYTPDTLEAMDRRGEIYWSPTGNPRRKIFLDKSPGKPVQDLWLDVKDAHNQNIRVTGYPTEKNPLILERIIEASSNPGDIVLDCFCGSGTTMTVSERLERHWIGVDNSLQAISTTLRRFAIGTDVMGDFVKKNKNGKSRQMSLFPDALESEEMPGIRPDHQPIRDFTLYCEAGLERKLRESSAQWMKIIKASFQPQEDNHA